LWVDSVILLCLYIFWDPNSSFSRASRAASCLLYTSFQLGYYISSPKSQIAPTQRLVHLGFGIDSTDCSFFLPERRRMKFRGLREQLLGVGSATLHDMQSFVGKCNSLALVFPAANLFTCESRLALSSLSELSSPLSSAVLQEVAFWRFVDSFTDPIPWRREQHVVLCFSSDASNYAWGACVSTPSGVQDLRDYWTPSILRIDDMCLKEATALYFALQCVADSVWDSRVDAQVDNEGLWHAWSGLRAHSPSLASILRDIFLLCLERNTDLRLIWVPSAANPADAPSRQLSSADSALCDPFRHELWARYGPFSIDLMALHSDVFRRPYGSPIPFFAPTACPGASGVNVFAQSRLLGVLYVFPPFIMIPHLLQLFLEWGDVAVVIVAPDFASRRHWWCFLRLFVVDRRPLSSPADIGVLFSPSKSGFILNSPPLPFGPALRPLRPTF
jgi:hypothetical protein